MNLRLLSSTPPAGGCGSNWLLRPRRQERQPTSPSHILRWSTLAPISGIRAWSSSWIQVRSSTCLDSRSDHGDSPFSTRSNCCHTGGTPSFGGSQRKSWRIPEAAHYSRLGRPGRSRPPGKRSLGDSLGCQRRSKIPQKRRSKPQDRCASICWRRRSGATIGHGIAAFGHAKIAALAHELWQARGCPHGSPQED
jgi:Protein of unknown function (DUF2934)